MTVLDRIQQPRDLRLLHREELLELCREIREFTVESVQKTGGHISSSLGTVELTVALHRVFDSPRDKLVWDTGHQAYVHKMLTGRRGRFDTLRQFGGISGFLARSESEHDQFGAGHAGTSISAAQGMADGHDLFAVEGVLEKARDFAEGPVFVHVQTQKGHGYGPAEDDNVKWHGVSATGSAKATAPQYTAVFADSVREVLKADERAVAITAAMPGGTGLLPLFREFPERLFDVGICEQHAVTFAAGLATQGIVPIVAVYSTFLQRGFDQVVHDVAVQGLPVVFAIDRGGIVGDDGRTHQGLYDIAYLRILPGMTLMAPKDEAELRQMMWTAYRHAAAGRGPIGVRFPRGAGVGATLDAPLPELTIGVSETLREGDGVAILAYGHPVGAALEAAEILAKDGLEATVVNARFAKPLDAERILALAARIPRFVTIEEHVIAGGFGSAVGELLAERGTRVDHEMLGIPDEHVDHGAQKLWRKHYGLDAEGIAAAVRRRWPRLAPLQTETEESAG